MSQDQYERGFIMGAALEGLKVIEMGHVIAGPFCGGLMGDFGAEVIKVETPGSGDNLRNMGAIKNMLFCLEGRNKKCITLNLKEEKGKEILGNLLKDADVLIENYRPGVLEKLGFGWDNLQKINPRLILVSISGYGQTGPYRDRPGYDSIGLSMGGMTYVSGFPDGPPCRPGMIIGDYLTGAFAALGVMMAIYNRDVVGTNRGQIIDASLYESIFRISETMVTQYSYNGTIQERIGNAILATVPSGVFKTKEGKWITMSVGNDKLFNNLVKAIGKPEFIKDPRFSTQLDRVKYRPEIEGAVQEWLNEHTLDEVREAFGENIPMFPVYNVEDICNDPHYAAREDIIEIEDYLFGKIKMQNAYPKLSATPGEVKWTGPAMGAHNEEIYNRLGISNEKISELLEQGII